MDAPPAEVIVRIALALLVTVTAGILLAGWDRPLPSRPLLRFLAVAVVLNAAWRWGIVWIGFQRGEVLFGLHYPVDVEPWVRSLGNAVLILLYLAIALIAAFHLRRRA